MGEHVKNLAREAQQLTREERIELVEAIFESLYGSARDNDAAWEREIEDRWQAYLRGEIPTRRADEVLGKHLKP